MKRILFIIMVIVLAAPAAWAQTPFVPSFQIGAGAGMSMPMGTMGDGMNNGYNVNASIGYQIAPTVVLGAEMGLWGNGANDATKLALGGDMDLTSWEFAGMAKYKVPVAVHAVYAKGLAGMYHISSDITSSVGDFSVADTKFGFGMGGGFEFGGLRNTAIYGEAMYHRINGDGGDAEFMTLNVGVLFSI